MKFNLEIALQIYNSDDEFPIDFEDAWIWLGYSNKGNAKRAFEKSGFIAEIDFHSFIISEKREIGATQKEIIHLSIDCFKNWAMLSKTEKGKEVRLYFLECEKLAKTYQIEKQQPVEKILPSRDATEYINAAKTLESLQDGILKQLLSNALVDEISLAQNLKYLPVADKGKQYTFAQRCAANR
jgi:anti-repressor protein